MVTVVPDEGKSWYRDKGLDVSPAVDEKVYVVAVGDGTNSPQATDTQLQNELYRASDDDSPVSISATTNVGEMEAKITVNGGTEVDAGDVITEFGIWALDPANWSTPYEDGSGIVESEDVMIYHEVRSNGVTIESGDTKTFTINYTVKEA